MFKNFINVDSASYNNRVKEIVQKIVVYFFLRPYYKIFFKMEVQGKENLPEKQSVILAATHSSYHDPPLLSSATVKPVSYMAKKELFKVPVLSQMITILGAFPVNREKLEVSTIRTAKHILTTENWNLGIFPQGTRIKPGIVCDIKPGFGYLAKVTKSTIVPVLLQVQRGRFPFYGKTIVKIGKPLPHTSNPEEISQNWITAINELADYEYVKVQTENSFVDAAKA